MKTDDFAALLASQVEAVPRHALARRLGLTLAAGTALAAALLAGGYGTRPDLAQAMGWPMFWVKLLFPLCVAVPALVMVQRLGMFGRLAAALADGLNPVDRGVHVLVDVLVVVHGGADHLLQLLDEAIHAAGKGANLVVA